MRLSLHYNTPMIVEKAVEVLNAEGSTKTWSRHQLLQVSLRQHLEKSQPANNSPIEVQVLWTVAIRDDFQMDDSLQYYRFRVGTKLLYPKTYFRYNGTEYVAIFVEEEDQR